MAFSTFTTIVALTAQFLLAQPATAFSCDTPEYGFQCNTSYTHNWGQYSPYYTVPSEISADVPAQCKLTFAQILSRHGARSPTASKTTSYNATIVALQKNVTSYTGKYAFLANYTYSLGADDLTEFGEIEMINSGIKFYDRYESLAKNHAPFVRSSSEARVVESAQNWTQGFHSAKTSDRSSTADGYPYSITVITEADGSNNTLNHDLCTSFEDGYDSNIATSAQSTFAKTFVPAITRRLESDLPGLVLTTTQTIYLMDICTFETVNSPTGVLSPFCLLFNQTEWVSYDYYESLNKWYGFGPGNPLGPTQGVGFTNELLARLTSTPVHDETSTNHTLDSSPSTFPLGRNTTLYADFSHDNDMTGIMSALGLFNNTQQLSNTTVEYYYQLNGYSASRTVPYAARMYVEKMSCHSEPEESVRIIINDRVWPLVGCGADHLGRCTLSKFVKSQSFARDNGLWSQCFA